MLYVIGTIMAPTLSERQRGCNTTRLPKESRVFTQCFVHFNSSGLKWQNCLNSYMNITNVPTVLKKGSSMFVHALKFVLSRGSCLNTRRQAEYSNHLSRDPANVDAMKQTWVVTILAFYLDPV